MATPVVIKCEVAWGANLANAPGTWTWTDITSDFRAANGIRISTGRSDEASQTQSTSVMFAVNDPLGNYVPRNARGKNFPNVRQNTPFRFTIATGVRTIVYGDSYTPTWDESLTNPIVMISASGILRRLAQGRGQSRSAMRRHIEALAPQMYLPLEDGLTSAMTGGTMAAVAPTGGFTVDSTSHPAGSSGAMRRANNNATLSSLMPVSAASSARIDFAVQTPTTDTTGPTFVALTVAGLWSFNVTPSPADDLWHHHRIEIVNVSGTAKYDWYVDGVQIAFATTLGTWSNVTGFRLEPGVAGFVNTDAHAHVAMWSPRISADTYQAFLGYPGETATTRLTRLCSDAGILFALTGTSTTLMDLQPASTFVDALRSCEAADGGILSDGGSGGGLVYLARGSRYNLTAAFTLDSSLYQLAPPFQPIEDDQRRRNDWTVSRSGGGSGRFVDATSPQGTAAVGLYDDSTTLGVASDADLIDQAAWRVHLGTVESMRYPTVTINLRARPELVTAWLAAGLGSRITLRNLPSQHGPGDVDLVVEGWSEVCDGFEWLVSINAGAYEPWRINVVADAQLGRLDTGGSTLSSSATATTTSLSVATSTGPIWTTTATFPADFPFSIGIDGEQITVTAISGSSSPQTFTVIRAVNAVTKAHLTAANVALWKPGVLAL